MSAFVAVVQISASSVLGCVDVRSALDVVIFFFKQKTAYEMRISDWSSDVCSSDLADRIEADYAAGIASAQESARAKLDAARGSAAAALDAKLAQSKIGRASCRERVCLYV